MKLMNPQHYGWCLLPLVMLADQGSKHWVLYGADLPHRPPIVINAFLSFVMVWNHGVSFGMLNQGADYMPWLLTLMAVVVSALLLRLAVRTQRPIERVAYAMVIAGALSNALDRVRFGAVVDFIYAHIGDLGWPAFNVADACICVGVMILLLFQFKKSPDA